MFFLLSISVKMSSLNSTLAMATCDICSASQAVKFCTDCKKIFCGGCTRKHDQFKRFEEHSVVQVEEVTMCPVHHRDPVTEYCRTCSLSVCSSCVLADHQNHNIADLDSIVRSAKMFLRRTDFWKKRCEVYFCFLFQRAYKHMRAHFQFFFSKTNF